LNATPSDWTNATIHFDLQNQNIHVWRLKLDVPTNVKDTLRKVLSPDELERADRFIRKEHTTRFITGRAVLRYLLASYLNDSPQNIIFTYNKYGKPSLKNTQHNITFNVSNTKGLAVIAITRENELGIDIESHRTRFELEKIVRRYFSETEVDVLFSLNPTDQKEAFYRCWSSKEAFMKVCGRGLSIGLNRFDVEVRLDKPPRLLRVPDNMGNPSQWEMCSLPMGEKVAGVLALEGKIESIKLFNIDPATLL
jgi:4'-phosphopantetheinyl transferase